jgi:protein-S-isoprenylcysteine O-methyltransferase Ste14
LIASGALLALSSIALFARFRTTVLPHGRPSTFVDNGAYARTRNPMYVGLTLVYLGISALAGALWAVFLVPLPMLAIDRWIIPMEEEHLESLFGERYREFKSRVPRWL